MQSFKKYSLPQAPAKAKAEMLACKLSFRRSRSPKTATSHADFNTSETGETEIPGRFLPPHPARKHTLFCETAHFAMRYRPFCIAIWPILQAKTALLAGQKGLFCWPERPFWRLEKLHSRAYKAYKSHKVNRLRPHTQDWRICGQKLFIFKYAEYERPPKPIF